MNEDFIKELEENNLEHNKALESLKNLDFIENIYQCFSKYNFELFDKTINKMEIDKEDLTNEEKGNNDEKKSFENKSFLKKDKTEIYLKNYESGLIIISKLLLFKKHEFFYNLLRYLKIQHIQKSALLITSCFKKFFEKMKKKNQLVTKELQINEELRNNLIKDNLLFKSQENYILTLDDIRSIDSNHKIIESNINDSEDSRYSDIVIDLVRIIQFYLYDKSNSVNKYNYLIRIFNKWRSVSKSKSQNYDEISKHNLLESFPNVSPLISESIPQKKIIRTISLQNSDKFECEKNYIGGGGDNLKIYNNYINNLNSKFEKFTEKIKKFSLISLFNHVSNKKINKSDISNYTSNLFDKLDLVKNNNQWESINKENILYINNRNSIIKENTCKNGFNTFKNSSNLEVFSFHINIGNTENYNLKPIADKKKTQFVEDITLINNSVNFKVNKSSIIFDPNNNLRRNINNQSLLNYHNFTSLNNQSIYSKTGSFNSELKSDEELDELNDAKISCVIGIQNLWRKNRLQKYIFEYSRKLKILDKYIKIKNYKLKNKILINFARWKKNNFVLKLLQKVLIIQKYIKKRKFRIKYLK